MRKVLVLLLWNGLCLVIILALAEVGTRFFAPHPRYPEFSIPDERVGYLPQPGHHGRATNMFGEFDTDIRINREGFRDVDRPLQKPPGTIRLAFIGDSFTYAEQVEEPHTFVRRTEALLNKGRDASQPRIECMNCSVGGWDTYHEVFCYEKIVRKYHPDVVVLCMFMHNDVSGNAFYLDGRISGRPYFRLTNGRLEAVPADLRTMKECVEDNQKRFGSVKWYQYSQFYNLFRVGMWSLRQQSKRVKLAKRIREHGREIIASGEIWKEPVHNQYRYYALDPKDPYVVTANELNRLLLERLNADVQADGGRLMAVLLPAWENVWPEHWPERAKFMPGMELMHLDFARPFDLVIPIFTRLEVPMIDLRPVIRNKESQHQACYFRMDNHFNGTGQETAAQAIAPWLQERIRSWPPPFSGN